MATKTLMSNIKKGHATGRYGCASFNCWGATLYALGEINNLQWISDWDMLEFLGNNTEIINENKLKKGDILVLYGIEEDEEEITLIHTAIYINKDFFWHKRGENQSEFATLQTILEIYWKCVHFEYRRLIK